MVFGARGSFGGGIKKKKPPVLIRGFSEELEFKVFVRIINQAGFSGIFGCFSDIGYSNVAIAQTSP
jgi:hypothetical protein